MLDFEVNEVHFVVSAPEAVVERSQQVDIIERLRNRARVVPRAGDRAWSEVDAWRRQQVVRNGSRSISGTLQFGTRPPDGPAYHYQSLQLFVLLTGDDAHAADGA
jgi:hypothetical protein